MALPSTAFASNDPLFSQQWGLAQIGAPSAWATSTGAGVKVGIVDTGVDLNHEDLAGQILMSTNCIGANGDPSRCTGSGQDDNGHGTHVAGIIAAVKDNGKGIAGVAPSAKLIVAKALDANGAGADADVQAGIMWVVDHGAQVVNLSLGDGSSLPLLGGSNGLSAPMTAGIEYAWSHGAIPVLAAGNSGGGLLSGLLGGGNASFGSLHAIITGATGPSGAMAAYSSPLTADNWAIAAPGGANDGTAADDVTSTWWASGKPNQYLAIAGTSMATPHVAGAVADVLATGLGQQATVDRILTSADTVVPCGASCAGLLDVSKAVGGPATPAPTGGGSTTGASGNLLGSLLGLLGL
jgi:subtilisin family serine protease